MRRKIYDKLLEWKKNHKGDTALLIEEYVNYEKEDIR